MLYKVARLANNLYNVLMAKRKTQTNAEKAVKRAIKKNPKAFIFGIVAAVLIVAVTLTIIYFAAPDVWDAIASLFVIGNDDGNDPPTLNRGDGELQIHFIDVGQGDCILILFPDGKDMLIDCANYNGGNTYRDETLNYLDTYVTDDQLDYLMLTHCDSDHVYYLDDVLHRYDVDNIYMPFVLSAPDESKESNAERIASIAALPADKLDDFSDPDTIDTGVYADFFIAALTESDAVIHQNIGNFSITTDTYRLDFYAYTENEWADSDLSSAEERNAISPIGVLEYNGKKIVLTGDSNEINEPKFIDKVGGSLLDCDVLKVGHHGSETSSTEEFLDFINCEQAIISCNASGNTFNHPRKATLDRLKNQNMSVYRTDLNGNIVLSVNAEGTLTITTEKTAEQSDIFTGADAA